jgi:uncharacterized protein
MNKLHLFRDNKQKGECAAIDVEKIISGSPSTETINVFQTGDGRVFGGIWRVTPGSWRVKYDECEYCYIIKGKARLSQTNGTTSDVAAGDGFVIEQGFEGTWEVFEDLEKHYMIVYP